MENHSWVSNTENSTPHGYAIKGIDLKIDAHTQVLCETYNRSSGVTRSVLYVLLLVNVIMLIAVFNSNWKFNWTNDRLRKDNAVINNGERRLFPAMTRLRRMQREDSTAAESLKVFKGAQLDSAQHAFGRLDAAVSAQYFKVNDIRHDIDYARRQREALEKSAIENYYMVKVNFIGIAFDVNDLGSIGGLTLIILLVVLRFTITREKNNVKLAFNSITERYPDDADKKDFKDYFAGISLVEKRGEPRPVNVIGELLQADKLADINYVRRRYHYNFLSMNEVFNLPKLSVSKNTTQNKLLGKIINEYLFFFPLVVYAYAVFNDMCTLTLADGLSDNHTVVIETLSCVFFIYVSNLCRACVEQKGAVKQLFSNFFDNGYIYDHGDYEARQWPLPVRILAPCFLLAALLGLSVLWNALLRSV